MEPEALLARIESVAAARGAYPPAAYTWIFQVLDHVRRVIGREGHVTGRELLEGHRALAYEEFGPMAWEVMRHWNLRSGLDVGRVVFDLVDAGLLGKTEEDSIEDFKGAYDFERAFTTEFPW